MKVFKIFFSILGLLILISLLAFAGFLYFFDPNKLKPVIAEEVKKQTGYELMIDGKLSWAFYPRLAVKIDHMSLQAPKEASAFIELQNTRVGTDLFALLKGREKLQGELSIENIRYLSLHAKEASASLHWNKNVLTINKIKAKAYSGTLEGVAHGRGLMTTLPNWDFNLQFKQIELQALLQDLNGQDAKVKMIGKADIKVNGTTAGKSKASIIQNLNGALDIFVSGGSISGIDFNYLVQTAEAILNKQVVYPPVSDQTAFNQFTARALIKNGLAETSLQLAAPAFMVNGVGNINLNNEMLNLALKVRPEDSLKNQWEIPMQVTGPIDNPETRLDRGGLEALLAKQELEKIKTKASEIIEKNVPGKAGQFLQNLIGK